MKADVSALIRFPRDPADELPQIGGLHYRRLAPVKNPLIEPSDPGEPPEEDEKPLVPGKRPMPGEGGFGESGEVDRLLSIAVSTGVFYDIDVTSGTPVKQAPPNDGILNTIGKLVCNFLS